jgi:TRAP-type C4-dicarboxylate transport system permease small subunit
MSWGAIIWMQEAWSVKEVTLVLRWPTSYFILVETIGMLMLTVVCLVQMINAFKVKEG